MTTRSKTERLIELLSELALLTVRREEDGQRAPRVAALLGELRELLREVAVDVRAAGPNTAEEIAQLIDKASAALESEPGGTPNLDAVAARLRGLVEDLTGMRTHQEEEWAQRIRKSAERSVAEALRKAGLNPPGSKE